MYEVNIKDHYLFIGNTTSNSLIPQNKEYVEFVEKFLSPLHYEKMIEMIDDQKGQTTFLNDLEIIYLFVHEKKDQDDRKNRNQNTKREYLRELLFFYQNVINNLHVLQENLTENKEAISALRVLEPRHIRKYNQWLSTVHLGKGNKPYSVATIARKTVILKSFLRFLYNKKYIDNRLDEVLLSAKVDSNDRPNRDVNVEEMIQILNYYKDHPILYCLLSLLATTGIRINELCTSRISDITIEKGNYWLNVMGKGGEKRDVLIHDNVFKLIERFRSRRGLKTELYTNDHSPLFTTNTGRAYTYKYLSKYISKVLSNCDIPLVKNRKEKLTAHNLRHFYAIYSDEQGESIYRISKSLGHKSINTTEIYLQKKLSRDNNASHSWKNSDLLKIIN